MIKQLKHIASISRQFGASMTEYIPVVVLIGFVSVVGYAQYGHVTRDHGGKMSKELAGQPSPKGQSYAENTYSGGRTSLGNIDYPGSSVGNNSSSNNTGSSNSGSPSSSTGSTDTGTGAGAGTGASSGTGSNPPTDNNNSGSSNTEPTLIGTAKEFLAGFWEGLKQQGWDALEFLIHPVDTATNIYELGKALINDPEGTIAAIKQELGKDADALLNGTARQRGEVLGKYISPVAVIKIVTKLSKLGKISKNGKKRVGCSSFAAGTMVWTPSGLVPIETIEVGNIVSSRSDETYLDSHQNVTKLMGRTVPHYYHVSTGFDDIKVTEEHPFWLQGKGWVAAKDLISGNAVAAEEGDLLIRGVKKINSPLKVYNFSVANTHTYFVSKNKLWVHNANSNCTNVDLSWSKVTPERTVASGKVGDTPTGTRSDPKSTSDTNKAYRRQRENDVADILSKNGYKVEQKPTPPGVKPTGAKASNIKPDYKIEGKYADLYTPDPNTSMKNMLDAILDKNKNQASTVVLDLSKSKLTPDDLAKAIYQGDITTGVSVTDLGKKKLRYAKELIVIDAKGNFNTIFPP